MKKKIGLKKKIFILFFAITFVFVLLLSSVVWYLARYGIRQYEDGHINKTMTEVKLSLSGYKSSSYEYLRTIMNNNNFINSVRNNSEIEPEQIPGFNPNKSLFIYDKNLNRIYGQEWEVTDFYKTGMFMNNTKNTFGNFMVNSVNKIYSITYSPIYSGNSFLGLIASVELANTEMYNLNRFQNVLFNSYPIEKTNYINISNSMVSRLNDKIEKMITINKSESILRLNIEIALGVHLMYDLTGKPAALFMVVYPRDFNSFIEQGLFLFLFIILGFSVIIVSLLGLWFSKSIMNPIKNISNKMQFISNNPTMLEIVPEKYRGELGEMVRSFNNMNRSLEKYSKSLIEYKIITNNLDSGIFWLDSNLQIILCNPGFMRIVGKGKKSDVMKKKLTAFIDLKHIHIERSRKTTLTLPEIKLKNSKKFVVLNMKMAIDDSGEKFVGSITEITSEISERNARQSLEFELIKSNKLAQVGRLAEGIVHNINSPLNSILGYSQLIKKKLGTNEDLERVIEAGKNISQYVKVLLKKVRNDNISMLRPVNINEVISQELEMCQHNLFFKHYITLKKELGSDIPDLKIVHGDYSLCVANLLNNAIDSMRFKKQKDMFIRTYSENKNVVFEIKDSGEGILEKDLEHIFDPYFSTKTKTEKSGYGLGLAITKSIINKYNGTIKVSSVKDSGSTFQIIIPVEQTGYKENYE